MKIISLITVILLLAACTTSSLSEGKFSTNSVELEGTNTQLPPDDDRPKIELVFCLDATGSMSGLIQTAKDKIWDITSSMAQNQKQPDIRLGMVFYRDRGDDFVTKMYPLTTDIDSIYTELLAIQALGGGDTPESVNRGLQDAIDSMGWSDGANVYRTVFLVGDCPPHMDYQDEQSYETTCSTARQKSIVINTIKLGKTCTDAIPHFQKVAKLTDGHYMQLDQNASDVVIQTPYDDSINFHSYRMEGTKLYYGSDQLKISNGVRKDKANAIYMNASAASNSDRASYNMSSSGRKNLYGEKELLNDIEQKKVSLDTLSKDALPDEFEGLTKQEIEQKVSKTLKERKEHEKRLLVLIEKRREFIEKEQKKSGEKNFSQAIIEVMQKQALKQGVEL